MAELVYELTFKGAASSGLRAAFDDCGIHTAAGRSTLRCRPEVLHEMLDRVQSFGLELLRVRLLACRASNDAAEGVSDGAADDGLVR